MTNAKEEFLGHVENKCIKCAVISFLATEWQDDVLVYGLPITYTVGDLQAFLEDLDCEYDSGYGGQELFGTIWYTDGTWSTRGEYDGSEWWEHHSVPEIPEHLHN